jgi:hypothetical protein
VVAAHDRHVAILSHRQAGARGAYSDAEMLGLLDRVLTQTALDLEGSIVVVDRRQIRRRALPIIE